MPISLTLLLVLAGIVLLAFGIGSTGGAIRFLSGGVALLVATLATVATIGLFWLGQRANWTSDGPGALFVMIAVVVCAIVAVVGWLFVFGIASRAAAPVDAHRDTPPDAKRVLRLLGFALLALAVVGQAVTAFVRRPRAAHSSPVVALSFGGGGASLVSVDAGGTFVEWDLRSKRETRRRTLPELAGSKGFFVDSSGNGFAVANGQALRFAPFGDAPVETIPEARHIARGHAVVVAKDRTLLFVSYDDWTKAPLLELAWAEPILAIAARDMYVAVADRANISILDGRATSLRMLRSVPAPGAITGLEVLPEGNVLALDGSGAGWAINTHSGVTEPLAAQASLVAGGRHVFSVFGREVSEYDLRKKRATRLATVGSGARSIDTWGAHVALGFEHGELLLGTRSIAKFETERLTAKRRER